MHLYLLIEKIKQAVVIITLDDCHAFKETAYLLKSLANAKRLRDSIAQIEATETTCHKLSKEWDWDAQTMVEIAPDYTPKFQAIDFNIKNFITKPKKKETKNTWYKSHNNNVCLIFTIQPDNNCHFLTKIYSEIYSLKFFLCKVLFFCVNCL